MSQLEQLYRLQQLDTEIRQKKRRLGEVVELQKETPAVRAARSRAAKAAATLKDAQAQQNELNLELGTINSKAKRSEQRLYSGNVKNPKELSDLQHELEALGRRRAVLEDELLEAMIMVEEAQEEKTAADENLAEVEATWRSNQQELEAEQNELALRLHHLLQTRKEQAAAIDKRRLADYEAIARSKGGLAVAGLREQTCLGCHLTVSEQLIKQANRDEIVYCGGCGRILFAL